MSHLLALIFNTCLLNAATEKNDTLTRLLADTEDEDPERSRKLCTLRDHLGHVV